MDEKINVQLTNKEKQALSYILGESLEENDDNTTFAQKIKNVAKKGLLTASLVLALLPNLNAQQTTQVTQEFVKCSVGVNADKSQENINQQQKLFQTLKQSGIIQENKDGTITIKCKSKLESAGNQIVSHYMTLCRGMGYVPVPSRSIKMINAQYDKKKGIYVCSVTLKKVQSKTNNTIAFENKQYNNMNKKQLYESIMSSVSKEVKKALNESRSFESYIQQSIWEEVKDNTNLLNKILSKTLTNRNVSDLLNNALYDYRTGTYTVEDFESENGKTYTIDANYIYEFITPRARKQVEKMANKLLQQSELIKQEANKLLSLL